MNIHIPPKYNLYERNLYKFFHKNLCMVLQESLGRELLARIWVEINKISHNIFIDYIEIPITTKCSLRCKECSNLIQYYNAGSFFDHKRITNDVSRLCKAVNEIDMVRVLGGEPLLHPHLKEIITGLLENKNIHHVQIVTNGTMLFDADMLEVLRDRRVSVDISYYGKASRKYDSLLKQLESKRIRFYTNKNLKWTKQSDFTFQKKTPHELEKVLNKCKLDCISLMDGEMHLCPRSSNGKDLRIFKADRGDYVALRKCRTKSQMRKEIYHLLNRKSIVACNYCKVYMQDTLDICTAGSQIGKEEALKQYARLMDINREKSHEFNCVGNWAGVHKT